MRGGAVERIPPKLLVRGVLGGGLRMGQSGLEVVGLVADGGFHGVSPGEEGGRQGAAHAAVSSGASGLAAARLDSLGPVPRLWRLAATVPDQVHGPVQCTASWPSVSHLKHGGPKVLKSSEEAQFAAAALGTNKRRSFTRAPSTRL